MASHTDNTLAPVISRADFNKAYRTVVRIDGEYQKNVAKAKANPGDHPLSIQLQPWFFSTAAVVSGVLSFPILSLMLALFSLARSGWSV